MTSDQWLAKNPATHKCTRHGVNIRPEQCEKRKALAQEKMLGVKQTCHAFSSSPEVTEVRMSLRRCVDCPGPEDMRTSTYKRLDNFRESAESVKVHARRCAECREPFAHAVSKICPSCRRKKTILEKNR